MVLSGSTSAKLCEATVSLLAHFAEQELQAWPHEMLEGEQGQQQQEQQQQQQQQLEDHFDGSDSSGDDD